MSSCIKSSRKSEKQNGVYFSSQLDKKIAIFFLQHSCALFPAKLHISYRMRKSDTQVKNSSSVPLLDTAAFKYWICRSALFQKHNKK